VVCPKLQRALSEVDGKMNRRAVTHQKGFTIIQMVITVAIIAIVTTFGVLGITTARAEFRQQSSARLFATYIEKTRADSIRRHAATGDESSIETFGPGTTTYAVSMDFGSGAVETRNFQLESGLTFSTAAKKVSFDWRGRISGAWVFQVFSEQLAKSLPVDVSGSGDITVGEQHFPDQLIPPVEISQVTGDVDADVQPTPTPDAGSPPNPADPTPTPTATPTPTPNGNGNGNGGSGNGNGNGNNPTPTPTPVATPTPTPIQDPGATPTPTPMPPPCLSSISPGALYLSQSASGNQTGTATFTITNGTGVRTISATQAGNGNSMVLSLSLVRLEGNGSSILSVTTKHGSGNRGVFVVEVAASPACGSTQQLIVSISN